MESSPHWTFRAQLPRRLGPLTEFIIYVTGESSLDCLAMRASRIERFAAPASRCARENL